MQSVGGEDIGRNQKQNEDDGGLEKKEQE